MKVEIKNENEVRLMPEGRIDIAKSIEFQQQLLTLFNEGFNNIELDFSNVTGVDSAGLGKLLLFHKKLKMRSGELSIINVNNDYVKTTFSRIHLYKVIKIEGLS